MPALTATTTVQFEGHRLTVVQGEAYRVSCEGKCGGANGHIVTVFNPQPMTCDCPAAQHGLPVCKHRRAVARLTASPSPLMEWR